MPDMALMMGSGAPPSFPMGAGPPPPSMQSSPGPPSAPPSRPGTGLGNASDIDDLLGGPPGPRKGGTVKKGKRSGRYVDVMAK